MKKFRSATIPSGADPPSTTATMACRSTVRRWRGLSKFPAWRVATAATFAGLRDRAPIIGVQVEYSLAERTAERELLPMAEAFGLGAAHEPVAAALPTVFGGDPGLMRRHPVPVV